MNRHLKILLFGIFIFIISFSITANLNSQVIYEDTSFVWGQTLIHSVHVLDSNIALLGGNLTSPVRIATFMRNSNGVWKKLSNNGIDTNAWCVGIWAKDTLNIVLATNNRLYNSSNGGESWNPVIQPYQSYSIQSMIFSRKNKSTGYILTTSNITTNKFGIIYSTTDYGLSWIETSWISMDSVYGGFPIENTCVTDSLNYYIGFFNSPQVQTVPCRIGMTSDGGWNWYNSYLPIGQAHSVGGVAFKYDNETGIVLASGFNSTVFYKTTNRGLSWYVVRTDPSNGTWGLDWIPDSDIFFASMGDRLLKSSNNGENWSVVSNGAFLNMDFHQIENKIYGWLLKVEGSNLKVMRIIDSINTVNVKDITSNLPNSIDVYQNYPNPFNPETEIRFSIPSKDFVTLKVYNILGQLIVTLVDEELSAGEYKFNFNASGLNSGVYFYEMRTENFREVKKMTLLK